MSSAAEASVPPSSSPAAAFQCGNAAALVIDEADDSRCCAPRIAHIAQGCRAVIVSSRESMLLGADVVCSAPFVALCSSPRRRDYVLAVTSDFEFVVLAPRRAAVRFRAPVHLLTDLRRAAQWPIILAPSHEVATASGRRVGDVFVFGRGATLLRLSVTTEGEATFTPVLPHGVPTAAVTCAAASPCGRVLCLAAEDSAIGCRVTALLRGFSAETSRALHWNAGDTLRNAALSPTCVAVLNSPAAVAVVVGFADGLVSVLEAEHREHSELAPRWIAKLHTAAVSHVAFVPESSSFVSASVDGSIVWCVYDPDSAAPVSVRRRAELSGGGRALIGAVAFAASDNRLTVTALCAAATEPEQVELTL